MAGQQVVGLGKVIGDIAHSCVSVGKGRDGGGRRQKFLVDGQACSGFFYFLPILYI